MTSPDWIAVDWGTTRLRAWAMSEREVIAAAQSDAGMGGLAQDGFEPALLDLVGPWLEGTPPILACGMVGARQGWVEAPYSRTPCPVIAENLTQAPANAPQLRVHIAPGVSQDNPPDVMRGEETQIAGFLLDRPEFDGVLCLPGTHTKWVHISAGEIISFRSFMTGELFALLSRQSVLRHSVGEGWNADAFDAAVSETISRPERLAAEFFGLRAADLLMDQSQEVGTARLSGLLIGAELAATRPYWLGQAVALIGAEQLTDPYKAALAAQGVEADAHASDAITLRGLTAIYERGI